MEIAAVLVSVEHRTGVGGVVLDTLGDVWLVHSLDGGGGPRLDDYRPDHVGLEGERTLLGGRLPAGAGEALVLDDHGDRIAAQVGSGAWAVVLDQPTRGERSPVCFRNEDGVPVFEPLPVVCRICGYEEVMGSVISLQPRDETDDPAVVQARIRKSHEAQRLAHEMTLRATPFSIYAAQGLPGHLCWSGTSNDQVTKVVIALEADEHLSDGDLRVETAVAELGASDQTLAIEALTARLRDGLAGPRPASDAAFVLRLRAHRRADRQVASPATTTQRVIDVDGNPIQFTYIEAGHWAAVARTGPLIITLTATRLNADTVSLHTVPDPIKSLI
jgi:hypothetical protein